MSKLLEGASCCNSNFQFRENSCINISDTAHYLEWSLNNLNTLISNATLWFRYGHSAFVDELVWWQKGHMPLHQLTTDNFDDGLLAWFCPNLLAPQQLDRMHIKTLVIMIPCKLQTCFIYQCMYYLSVFNFTLALSIKLNINLIISCIGASLNVVCIEGIYADGVITATS